MFELANASYEHPSEIQLWEFWPAGGKIAGQSAPLSSQLTCELGCPFEYSDTQSVLATSCNWHIYKDRGKQSDIDVT